MKRPMNNGSDNRKSRPPLPFAEHDFNFSSLACPTLFVFAEQDCLLGESERKIPAKAEIHEVPQTDHFFREREEEVSTTIASFLLGID